MGAKTRVLPGFLDRMLLREVPPDGTVVDLFSGTGIVSAFCARHFRTIANDAQLYSRVITSSLIEHEPGTGRAFQTVLNPRRDLYEVYARNRRRLEEYYGEALEAEAQHLAALNPPAGRQRWRPESDAVERYRNYLELPGAFYGDPRAPDALYRDAAEILSERSLSSYRKGARDGPHCLVTAYYANVYFGLRQAIEIDSLRAALDAVDSGAASGQRKKIHYLSALLHAASVSTSGTSHFAQPRHLKKDSEVVAMARRRGIDVHETFCDYSRRIAEAVAATDHRGGNRALRGDYRALLRENGSGPVFDESIRADLIYVDPPYTADNYSRFYHTLESLAAYDYPELERDRVGELLRGRYPAMRHRFQSGFCRRRDVEAEFSLVIRAAAASGSKLVISYASPGGLLLKKYHSEQPRGDPVEKLERLCRTAYRDVRTSRRPIMHSGQGDSNIACEELLVLCRRPKGR